jgi:hypothetical protein
MGGGEKLPRPIFQLDSVCVFALVWAIFRNDMDFPISVQGRSLEAGDLSWLRALIYEHPDWNRSELSRQIARHWQWTNDAGQLKDIAARTMLRKLEQRQLITLPPRQRSPPHSRNSSRRIKPVSHPSDPITSALVDLQPVQLKCIEDKPSRELFAHLLHTHHYLSYSRPVGENLAFLIFDRTERPLGCLLFGAAAWKVAPRDEFIGWDTCARTRNLPLVANNMRFLILPWVRVPHLASHVLGLAARNLSALWQLKYGHPICLLETFVERERFRGTAYRAANWIKVGATKGRSRNDRQHNLQVPVKDIYCYPLHRQFHRLLCAK